MIPALITAGASILGGLLGSKNKAPTTTQKNEPWAPVQPWLQDNIATGQKLQAQYAANPFSPLQQQAYANTFADLDTFRNSVAPGLLDWAGNAMQGGYQRQNAERPGTVGYGAPVQRAAPAQPANAFGGLPGGTQPPPGGGYGGLLNFAPAPAPGPAQTSTMPTDAEAFDKMMREYQRRQYEEQLNSASSNWNAGYGGGDGR